MVGWSSQKSEGRFGARRCSVQAPPEPVRAATATYGAGSSCWHVALAVKATNWRPLPSTVAAASPRLQASSPSDGPAADAHVRPASPDVYTRTVRRPVSFETATRAPGRAALAPTETSVCAPSAREMFWMPLPASDHRLVTGLTFQ